MMVKQKSINSVYTSQPRYRFDWMQRQHHYAFLRTMPSFTLLSLEGNNNLLSFSAALPWHNKGMASGQLVILVTKMRYRYSSIAAAGLQRYGSLWLEPLHRTSPKVYNKMLLITLDTNFHILIGQQEHDDNICGLMRQYQRRSGIGLL